LDVGLLLWGVGIIFHWVFLWSSKTIIFFINSTNSCKNNCLFFFSYCTIYFHIVYQITHHLTAIIKCKFAFHRLNYYIMVSGLFAMRAICPNKHFPTRLNLVFLFHTKSIKYVASIVKVKIYTMLCEFNYLN
jgi:hypothetical protein